MNKTVIASIIGFVFIIAISCQTNQNRSINKPDAIILTKYDTTQTYTVAQELVCPTEMIHVQGNYCKSLEEHVCIKATLDKKLCLEFSPKQAKCIGVERPVNFCIDKEEFTDKSNIPIHNVTWTQAQNMCANVGKRLCIDYEWTKACEGPDNLPFAQGYKKGKVCNTDVPIKNLVKNRKLLDYTESISEYPKCLSSYGIHNMSGNSDEWVTKSWGSKPNRSGLKGGYFGGSRNMCRPMTIEHSEGYKGIQIGFRCCKDIK